MAPPINRPEPITGPEAPDEGPLKSRTIIALVVVLAAVLAGIDIYASHAAQSTLARIMPLMDHADDLHESLSDVRLAYADHVRTRNGVPLRNSLDDAQRIVNNIQLTVAGLDTSADFEPFRQSITATVDALDAMRRVAQTRMGLTDSDLRVAGLDTAFERHMSETRKHANAIHHAVNDLVESQIDRARSTSLLLYALFIGVVVAAFWLLFRQNALRREKDLELRTFGQGIEQSPASIVITNTGGMIEYVNPRFEEVTGYTRDEVIGQNPRILQSGRMERSFYEALWKTITSGRVWRGEILNKRKDGQLYWERVSISPIRDDDGTICHYVAVKEDVTERKADEEKLQQSRELFSRAFHSNPALIALSEPDSGRHVDVNESWCKTLKFSRDEAIGKTAFEMGLWPHVEDREKILAELEEQGRLRNFETQLKAKDGTLVDCLISTEPIVMDERELVLWSANDVTLRRRSERESEYRRILFEAIFNGIPDAIVYANPDREIVQVNPGLEKIFGYTQDDLLGCNTVRIYASEEEYTRQGRLRFHQSAEKNLEPYVVNYKRKDGTVFPGETLGTSIKDQDGNLLGFIGVIRDITDRTRMEGELIRAKEEAEYANYAKTQFLANMSHELRTPLNAILGFTEMIKMEAFGPLGNDKYIEYIDDITKSGSHLLEIITDILDIAKLEAGHLELHFEETDIAALVSSCLSILEGQAANKDIAITKSIPPDLPNIEADPLRMKQVIINLLSNAIKFNTAGGTVEIEAFLTGAGGLGLVVTDTGVGIEEEEIARVLEPFAQASDISTRAHEGSGLGLSLSKGLMEMHGGELHVESTPGEGTAVTCLLPPERTLAPAAQTGRPPR